MQTTVDTVRRRTSRILLGAALCLSWPLAPYAHGEGLPKAVTIPFIYEDARVYVPVRLGDRPPCWFILDTGATATIIDTAVARAAHLAVNDAGSVRGAGHGSSRQGETAALELHVGAVPLAVSNPAVMDLAGLLGPTSGRAPGGVIGSQFFHEHYVQLDFARRELLVLAPTTAPPSPYAVAVPLTFTNGTPLANVTLTLPGGQAITALALVDLGAKSTFLIPEPYIDRMKLRPAFPTQVVMGLGAGVGGDTSYAFARARRLALADAPAAGVDEPVIGLSVGGTLRSTWHEGLLGAEFLSRYVVGFDYARQRLLLNPQSNAAQRFDRSGLFLVADAPEFRTIVVRQVLKGSPADLAGLVAGDEIQQVDGTSAASLGLGEVRDRLKDPAGTTMTVRFRRNGQPHSGPLQLRDLL